MKTLEKNLWAWLKAGVRGQFHDYALHMERVENSIASGTPDVDGCLNGRAFKIELKTAERPRLVGTIVRVKFQVGQVAWLERRVRAGGLAWVLVQVGSGHAARRYLVHGRDAAAVELGVPESTLARLSKTPFDADAAAIVMTASDGL